MGATPNALILSGSMLWRELLRESRHRMHFVGRALFGACLAAIVFVVGLDILASSSRAPTMMARLGREIFAAYAVTQYFAIFIFSTIRAAGLSDERRTGSLPLIRITALSETGVVLGSFGSVMARAVLTMVLATPVLVISLAFGGFTLTQIALTFLITLASAAHVAALTTTLAAISEGSGAAIAVSGVLQLLSFAFAPWLMDQWDIYWLHSFEVVQDTVDSSFSGSDIVMFLGTRVVLTMIYLGLAKRLLERAPPRPTRPLKHMLLAADRFFLNLAKGRHILWRSGLPELRANPVYWRERAVSAVGHRDHAIRIAYLIGLAVLVVLPVGLAFSGPGFLLGWGSFVLHAVPFLVFVVALVILPAGAFVRERSKGAMPMLAVTPLTSQSFVLGKFVAVMRLLALPAGILAASFAFDLYLEGYLRGMGDFTASVARLSIAVPAAAAILYACAGARSTVASIGAGVIIVGFTMALGRYLPGFVGYFPRLLLGAAMRLIGVGSPIAAVFAVIAFLAMRRFRVVRNALFLYAGLAGSALLAVLLGMGAYSARGTSRFPPFSQVYPRFWWPPTGYAVGIMLVLAALIVWRLLTRKEGRRPRLSTTVVICLAIALAAISLRARVSPLSSVCTLALLGRAMWLAGPDPFNRAALATGLIICSWPPMTRPGRWLTAPGGNNTLVLVYAAVLTAFFLVMTCRQLDRLMERNG